MITDPLDDFSSEMNRFRRNTSFPRTGILSADNRLDSILRNPLEPFNNIFGFPLANTMMMGQSGEGLLPIQLVGLIYIDIENQKKKKVTFSCQEMSFVTLELTFHESEF